MFRRDEGGDFLACAAKGRTGTQSISPHIGRNAEQPSVEPRSTLVGIDAPEEVQERLLAQIVTILRGEAATQKEDQDSVGIQGIDSFEDRLPVAAQRQVGQKPVNRPGSRLDSRSIPPKRPQQIAAPAARSHRGHSSIGIPQRALI